MNINLVYQRMAELYVINENEGLTQEELGELFICLKANAHHIWEQAYKENMQLMDSLIRNIDYDAESSLKGGESNE